MNILNKSKKITFFWIIFWLFQFNGIAQNSILDKYINQAIESNSVLKQKQLSYEKSLLTLKEAKQMFYPTVSFVAQYEYNYGGRTINMPFADMLNPVYQNLDVINQFNSTIPGYPNIPNYPQIDNVETQLSPKEQQRTQVELEMPIYNKALFLNKKLQKQLSEISKITADSYKKELIKQVKSAYLDYNIALQTVAVGDKALALVKSSLAVTNSLYKNDKVTIDEVYSAKAKLKDVENQILEINKGVVLTKAYFNFLLNKKYNDTIELDTHFSKEYLLEDVNSLLAIALSNRDEIKLLDLALQIDETNIKMEKSAFLPLFYLNGSTGFWSDDYKFNNDTYFASISISAKWDIFTGGQTKNKIKQAKIDQSITTEKKKDLENNISLEVVEAFYNVKTAKESLELSKLELENYKESLKIIEKKKINNLATQLEYDIAFTEYFEAEINFLTNKNKYFQKIIELEFITNK